MSDSFKNALKLAVFAVFTLVLCLALAIGVAACGDDSGTATTAPNGTATTGGTVTTGTSGGNGAGESSLVGKWASAALKETWEFADDGTMTITMKGKDPIPFTYSVEGDVLVLVIDGSVEEFSMSYSVAGDVLTIEEAEQGETDYERVD